MCVIYFFVFFQAEDGIRDGTVTGVQTCALPIWEGPLEPVLQVSSPPSHGIVGPREDVALLPGADVEPREVTVAAGEDDVGIIGAGGDPTALAAADLIPVLLADRPAIGAARDAHRAVVLLRAADLVGNVRGGDDVVELGRGLVVLAGPGGAAVVADVGAAVVAVDHAIGIVRRDPEPVVVAVRRAHRREGATAIDRAIHAGVQHVHGLGIFGIGVDVRVVPGALAQIALVVRAPPRVAAVVGAEHSP